MHTSPWHYLQQQQQPFTALCLVLPGWAGARRNTHPPIILIIIQSLLASSISYNPYHPPCSYYVLGNPFAQPLSTSSFAYLLVWSTPPHIPYVSSPNVYEDKRYLTQMLVTSTFNKAERSQCPHSSSTNLRLQEPFSNLFGKWRPLLVKCYVKIRLETKRQQNTNWMTNADNYTGQWPQTTENNQLSVKNTDTRRGRIPSEKSPGRLHQR